MGRRLNTGATIVDTVEGLRELDVYKLANRETRALMETRPGFFDPRTGQIVINLERCRDAADVASTVLHETAGHYGLRELVAKLGGKEGATAEEKNEMMSRWCMDLYERLDGKTRAEVARAAARNGWRLDVAVEERMSELAEIPEGKMTAAERGVWNRVRAWAKRLLMDVFGIDHLPKWVKLTDAELRYMVKRSRLNLENRGLSGDPMEVAEDIVLRQDLGLEDRGDGIAGHGGSLLWRAGDPEDRERVRVRDEYEGRLRRGVWQSREALQDSMLSMKTAMLETLRAEGNGVEKVEDVASWEIPYLGKIVEYLGLRGIFANFAVFLEIYAKSALIDIGGGRHRWRAGRGGAEGL